MDDLWQCHYCGEKHRHTGLGCAQKAVNLYLRIFGADDLRRPPYRGDPDPLRGHCYVASEVVAYLTPSLKPYFVRVNGEPHWFLKNERGKVFDPTVEQFTGLVPYTEAKGKGFLTKEPSKRAQELLRRMVRGAS